MAKFTAAPMRASAIAADISRYIGVMAYQFGGAPVTGKTDCSGLVNQVLGADFGLTLPGGIKHFTGSWHGPASSQYLGWTGARTVGSPQAGDLVIWPGIGGLGHIGIAVSSTEMVSALSPSLGTAKTAIASTHPGVPVFRRVTAAGSGNPGTPVTLASSGSGCVPGAGLVALAVMMVRRWV